MPCVNVDRVVCFLLLLLFSNYAKTENVGLVVFPISAESLMGQLLLLLLLFK